MGEERQNGLNPAANAVPIQFSDSLSMSEFGEVRTAQAGNRADVEFTNGKQPLLVDDISSGNGTAVHQSTSRDVLLSVGGAVEADTGGLRLHYDVPYTPGNGQEIDLTGTLDAAGIGGGVAYAFLRSSVTGSEVVTPIAQSAWTSSTSDVDWSKSQIFRMSFQSLKTGRIQFSLVRDGLATKVTEITNDNTYTGGYWQYPSLPFYWKIYNTATDTVCEIGYGDDANGIGFRYVYNGIQSTATARAICGTVKSQGGLNIFDVAGIPVSTSSKNTAKTVSTTLIPIFSLRVASTFNSLKNGTLVLPQAFSLQTNNPIRYQILYRPTLTGAAFAAVDATYSGVESDVTASAVTGGLIVDEDYISSGNNQVIASGGTLGRLIMSRGYVGVNDILTIAAIRTGSTDAAVYSAAKWREIR